MATYTSKAVTVPVAASTISDKFADLTALEGAMDNVPESERARIGEVTFTKDSLSIKTSQVGELRFQVVEHNPARIAFKAVSSPLPLMLLVNLKSLGEYSTELTTSVEADIPVMLKPMLGGMMQKAADSFGDLMARINGK